MPRRRKDTGRWQAVITLPPGIDELVVDGRVYQADKHRRIRVTTRGNRSQCVETERHLQTLADEQLRSVRLGLPVSVPTFEAFANQWGDELGSEVSASTAKGYRSTIRNHLIPFFGDTPLDKIWTSDIEDYHRAKSSYAPGTRNLHIAVLQRILGDAHARRLILGIPPMRRAAGTTSSVDDDDYWREDEVAAVLEALPSESRLVNLVPLGLGSGLRPGELFGLRWGDVDFRGGWIRVRQQYSGGEFKSLKSDHSERDVPMTAVAREALEAQRSGSLLAGALVFRQEDGAPYDSNYVGPAFDRLCRKAEVRRITPHKLRDTFAAWVLRGGVDIYTLSKWLGHSDISITVRHYAHLCPDRSIELAAALPSYGTRASLDREPKKARQEKPTTYAPVQKKKSKL